MGLYHRAPGSVFGGKAEIKGNSPEITARKFLQKYSNLFKIDADNSKLRFVEVTGNDKMNYVKFRQVYHNIPVYGTEYIITTDLNGAVLSAIGRHYPVDLNCATTASLNKDEAFNRAKNDIGSSEKFKLYRSDLLILPHKGKFRLAWKMDISTEARGGSWKYFVDANSGEVLEKYRVSSDAVETVRHENKPFEPVEKVNPAIIQPTVNSTLLFSEVDGHGNIYETYPDITEFGLSTNVTLPRMSDATNYVIGTYADVDNSAVTRASILNHDYTGISKESPQFDEVNVYYHIDKFRYNFINNFNFNGFIQIPATVSGIGEGAEFLNGVLRFYHDINGGLPDFAREAKVIYHEYTHAVVLSIKPLDLTTSETGGISEGLADYFAGSYTDNAQIGVYAFTGNNRIRDMSNPLYPVYSALPSGVDIHLSGEFFSSILWNIRNTIGKVTVDPIIYSSLSNITTTPSFQDFRDAMITESSSNRVTIQNKFAEKGIGDYANNPPGAPVNLTIAAAFGESPTLSWTPPNDPDISYYKLYRQKPSDLDPVYFALTSATSLTDFEVTRTDNFLNDDIKYYARTVDEEGDTSVASNIVNLVDTYAGGSGSFSANPEMEKIEHLPAVPIPDKFGLHQNYPNPFNPSTNITIDVPSSAYVILEVYNINGQKINTLADEQKQPGVYTYNFNGNSLASGVYFVRLTAGNYVKSMQIVLLK
ncbi:MAG: T9SS type A sorting domain-containing protein [Melioribacteraceae bacterium]